MKVLAIVVLALAVFGVRSDDVDVAGDVIKVINEILEKIPEPLVDVHDEKYTIDLLVEKLQFTLDDVVLKGIKALDITQMDYDADTGRLDYDLTFGEVDTTVNFDLDLSGLVNLEHHPKVEVDLSGLKLAGYTVVDTESTPNQLTDFKLLVSLGSTKIELVNILNDDELTETLNTLLNDKLPSIVDAIAADLEPIVSPIIQSAINIILRHRDD